MGLGQLPGPSSVFGDTSDLSQVRDIIAPVGFGVCDGAHRLDVMKRGRGPTRSQDPSVSVSGDYDVRTDDLAFAMRQWDN